VGGKEGGVAQGKGTGHKGRHRRGQNTTHQEKKKEGSRSVVWKGGGGNRNPKDGTGDHKQNGGLRYREGLPKGDNPSLREGWLDYSRKPKGRKAPKKRERGFEKQMKNGVGQQSG